MDGTTEPTARADQGARPGTPLIADEAGLALTQQQVARVEAILLEWRKRMTGPAAERNFPLYVEGWVEMLRKLRRQVDEYLGVADLVFDGDDADVIGADRDGRPTSAPAGRSAAEPVPA